MIWKHSNGYWYFDFVLRGQRYSKSTRSKNKHIAKSIEEETRSQILTKGYLPYGSSKKFFELCTKYEFEIPERSRKVIQSNLNVLKEYFGDRLLSEITPSLVNTYQRDCRAKGLSVARVNHLVATLKHMFKLAVDRWEWINESKVQKVSLLPGSNRRIRILTPEEEKKLLQGSPQWLKELIVFGLLSAFRLSEALSIKAKDVDFTNKLLTAWEVKGGGSRSIPISTALERFLREKMKVIHLSGRLFPFTSGKVEWHIRRVCKEQGIENFHYHDLRHCVVTRLLKSGVSPFLVQKFMSWKSLSMVQLYSHLVVEDIRSTAELLDQSK